MRKFYLNILNKEQKRIFPHLAFLTQKGFYLAGGTGLALQLGHRTSVDFDFYTQKHFQPPDLYQEIKAVFQKKTRKIAEATDTLFCRIDNNDSSFFYYEYPLVKKLVKIKGVAVASIEDIAAMKMIAVSHRPVKRDYVDVFFLLKIFPLKKVFSFVEKKYPHFNQYFSLRALFYFADIEEKRGRKVKVLQKGFSWEKAKEEIFAKTRKYQLAMLKK